MQGDALGAGLAAESAQSAKLGLDAHQVDEAPGLGRRRPEPVLHLRGEIGHLVGVLRAREPLVQAEAHADVGDVVLG